jgi:uncharacterized membrane protein (UPF0127 family)
MKRITAFFVFIFFAAGVYLILNKQICLDTKSKSYQIDNKNYCLLTADSSDEWERGLMFYKKPVNFDGMIFVFPKKEIKSFWNKNTYVNLDLYWMDGEKIVKRSYLPSILNSDKITTVESGKEVNRVVEIIK